MSGAGNERVRGGGGEGRVGGRAEGGAGAGGRKPDLEPLLGMLAVYARRNPGEPAVAERIRRLVETRGDCLWRTCFAPGHVTASAWIVSPDRSMCLLTHHRKLGRWLQLGGHVDGEARLELAALREAREESGLAELELKSAGAGVVPLDLDVHGIPARGGEPAHEHHDVRFLMVADPRLPLAVSAESHDVRWVEVARLGEFTGEESVLRLARKARAL